MKHIDIIFNLKFIAMNRDISEKEALDQINSLKFHKQHKKTSKRVIFNAQI